MRNEYQLLILKELFNTHKKSRVDLSKDLKINKTSISSSVTSLIEEGLVREISVGEASSKGGRRPIELTLNYEHSYFMAIDLSRDYISYCICNMNFEIKSYNMKKIKITDKNVIDNIKDIIKRTESDYIISGENKLKGITIAIHGIVRNNKIIFTPNYNIDQVDLLDELEKEFPDICFNLINESNAAALCEYYITQIDNLVTINVGSGLGAGIIIDGDLHKGNRGYGGEIGHMIIMPDGKECHCGNKGCFEQYCSISADIEYYNDHTKASKISSSKELIDLFYKNDSLAIETIDRNVKYMSIGINNLMKTIDPAVVYINSDLAYNIPSYLEKVSKNVKSTFCQDVSISVSKFNDKSTLIGSIYYSIIKFFELWKIENFQYYC